MILPKEIKWTFILTVILFIVGIFIGENIVIAASAIIFVVLSVGTIILEAIHEIEMYLESK